MLDQAKAAAPPDVLRHDSDLLPDQALLEVDIDGLVAAAAAQMPAAGGDSLRYDSEMLPDQALEEFDLEAAVAAAAGVRHRDKLPAAASTAAYVPQWRGAEPTAATANHAHRRALPVSTSTLLLAATRPAPAGTRVLATGNSSSATAAVRDRNCAKRPGGATLPFHSREALATRSAESEVVLVAETSETEDFDDEECETDDDDIEMAALFRADKLREMQRQQDYTQPPPQPPPPPQQQQRRRRQRETEELETQLRRRQKKTSQQAHGEDSSHDGEPTAATGATARRHRQDPSSGVRRRLAVSSY
eukprot:COSAG05_NODE_26_length_29797_cov_35.911139_21_plen_304_part_00